MTVVISNCSKRKRVPLDPALHAKDIAPGATGEVATRWMERLKTAAPVGRALDVYGGRAFVEAVAAARIAQGRLLVVSAGLGLIDSETDIPAYGLTTIRRDPDCILNKTGDTAAAWWAALSDRSIFNSAALDYEEGPILAALPSGYLAMVAEAWAAWPAERLARLRLFTKEQPNGLPDVLSAAWMPYDDRLDAVDKDHVGTQGDFAQRAVRHFATFIRGGASLEADRLAVGASLDGLSAREVPVRTRLSDDEIMILIHRDWDEVGGRSGAMLRRLRDDLGKACEQSRFKDLFKQVQARRLEEALS